MIIFLFVCFLLIRCSLFHLQSSSNNFEYYALILVVVGCFALHTHTRISSALNDSSYRETIESSSNYNNRLVVERKTRIPFIDSQTGIFNQLTEIVYDFH